MDKVRDFPQELKRWNWGAFLLCPIWCIRHGIWQGLFLLIPFFGFFVPFWLGATGSRKAWLKNSHESLDSFLKRQKRWGFAGLTIWITGLIASVGSLSYSLNYSDGMKLGLDTANSNKRMIEYFGDAIHKVSFFNGTYNYEMSPAPSTLAVAFDAVGSKNKGAIHFQWEKRGEDWIATEMAFVDSLGVTHQLVDKITLEDSLSSNVPYAKDRLDQILTRMIEEKRGYVILDRSKQKNDFIETKIDISEEEGISFSMFYSDGFTKENKKLYRSKNPIKNKEEVAKILSSYARGDDSSLSLIEWQKLISIQLEDDSNAKLIFGETDTI